MPTNFRPTKSIPFDFLFDGRLDKYGVREDIRSKTSASVRYLQGKDGFLRAHAVDNGADSMVEMPSFLPVPRSVFNALSDEFGTGFQSGYDPRYWGFETEEAWEAAQVLSQYNKNAFYNDLLRFARGEPHDFAPGSSVRVRGFTHVLETLPPALRRTIKAALKDPAQSRLPSTEEVLRTWPQLLRESGLGFLGTDLTDEAPLVPDKALSADEKAAGA